MSCSAASKSSRPPASPWSQRAAPRHSRARAGLAARSTPPCAARRRLPRSPRRSEKAMTQLMACSSSAVTRASDGPSRVGSRRAVADASRAPVSPIQFRRLARRAWPWMTTLRSPACSASRTPCSMQARASSSLPIWLSASPRSIMTQGRRGCPAGISAVAASRCRSAPRMSTGCVCSAVRMCASTAGSSSSAASAASACRAASNAVVRWWATSAVGEYCASWRSSQSATSLRLAARTRRGSIA